MLVAITGMEEHGKIIKAAMWAGLICCVLYLLLMHILNRLTLEKVICVILLAGCTMRIGYMLYTSCQLRAHDVRGLDMASNGKDGYLLRIIKEYRLPENNTYQCYQQPFYYFLGAFSSKIINLALHKTDNYSLVNAAKVVSCIASSYTMFLTEDLFRFMHISRKGTVFGLMLVAFSPVFFLTGGRVGEDALTTFFIVACLLFTLIWEKKPSLSNTIILALLYGCGMMTKLSVAIPALFTIIIYAKKIVIVYCKKIKADKYASGIFGKIALFGCISLPLGLWYSLRNYILFGQSFTFVLRPNDNNLYIGDISKLLRILPFDINNIMRSPYAHPYDDYNLPTYLVKSELFGEFDYEISNWIPNILLFTNIVLTVAVFFCIFLLIFSIQDNTNARVILIWAVLFMIFTLNSCLSYPFGCSMDYRYYAVFSVIKALALGESMDIFINKNGIVIISLKFLQGMSVLFSVLSCIMYCLVDNSVT